MEYTCFEGMGTLPFLMDEGSSTMNMNSASTSSASTDQLLESLHAQQQQLLNPNYYYNPPQHFSFPAVSWSTTDPTLLLTDQQQQTQRQAEDLFNIGSSGGNNSMKVSCNIATKDDDMGIGVSSCGLSSLPPTVHQVHHGCSSTDLHHHAAAAAEKMNLCVDTPMMDGGRGIGCGDVISSGSRASSIDPFFFCGGGGGGVNASPPSQWMQQLCFLPSEQYYSCGDALAMPKLVSDPFSDSTQQQQQQRPLTYYTSSTSVNCLQHEADSCGSSDRDRSTTSENITWINNNRCNDNSDISVLPNSRSGRGGDSVTGLMLSSSVVPAELVPDEYSSSIAAAAANEDVELAAVTTTTLDHVRHRHHHHRSTGGPSSTTTAVECGAAASPAPSGRVSWMPPGVGSAGKNNHVTTLDPLLQLQQMSNGLVPMLPRSVLGPFKPHGHRSHSLDNLPNNVQRELPFSLSTSQQSNYSSISPRYSPIMPPSINPGVLDNCTSSSGSLYKDYHSFSNRLPHQQQGAIGGTVYSSLPAGGMGGVKEFHVGGGFESRREYSSDQMTLLSASRKPNATSIEPQSVAARHRRKKISERVRVLEKLIPGGNKMDTASMLDEAIDYVKFLQLQVQLLESMGEPETPNSRTTAAPATTSTTTITTGDNNSSAAFYPSSKNCKGDGGALIGGGFGSSSHLSRSACLMHQVTIAATNTSTTKPTPTPPLILSEVLQEQLFKHKLCLVSLRQYCPQQQARRSC